MMLPLNLGRDAFPKESIGKLQCGSCIPEVRCRLVVCPKQLTSTLRGSISWIWKIGNRTAHLQENEGLRDQRKLQAPPNTGADSRSEAITFELTLGIPHAIEDQTDPFHVPVRGWSHSPEFGLACQTNHRPRLVNHNPILNIRRGSQGCIYPILKPGGMILFRVMIHKNFPNPAGDAPVLFSPQVAKLPFAGRLAEVHKVKSLRPTDIV
ncbi:hypothetical protein EDD37DRAFT_511608 [Exophiala viscosa]|uniref:Uncharacterized protein n=1 Tax=Exophiala viscosa TaxID=2486360 RepID=A0AAN6IEQ1_9EURO|nr:hypothetical protein EDD36DRAFT_179228 [Exophiala viscosa]KAI1622228.1 hypothetical protein EDD37DRAFT_511608 [Exophiala viscosa]